MVNRSNSGAVVAEANSSATSEAGCISRVFDCLNSALKLAFKSVKKRPLACFGLRDSRAGEGHASVQVLCFDYQVRIDVLCGVGKIRVFRTKPARVVTIRADRHDDATAGPSHLATVEQIKDHHFVVKLVPNGAGVVIFQDCVNL